MNDVGENMVKRYGFTMVNIFPKLNFHYLFNFKFDVKVN